MKTLLLSIVCAFQVALFTQSNFDDAKFTKEVIDPAEFIFEGTLKKTTLFRADNGQLYNASIIEVHKVFRGTLSSSKVVVLSNGCGKYYDSIENRTIQIELEDAYCIDANNTVEDNVAIYFCNISSYPKSNLLNSIPSSQTELQIQYIIGYDLRTFLNNSAANIHDGNAGFKHFEKIKDLYSYLQSKQNIKLKDLNNRVFEKADPVIEPFIPPNPQPVKKY